jgi:hypothetical protein
VFTSPLQRNGSYSIVACVFVAAGMLLRRCLAMDVCSGSAIPTFQAPCHNIQRSFFQIEFKDRALMALKLLPPHIFYMVVMLVFLITKDFRFHKLSIIGVGRGGG